MRKPARIASPKRTKSLTSFETLQCLYGLKKPAQIRERIIFNLLLAMVDAHYGKNTENRKITERYRRQWKVLEMAEVRI